MQGRALKKRTLRAWYWLQKAILSGQLWEGELKSGRKQGKKGVRHKSDDSQRSQYNLDQEGLDACSISNDTIVLQAGTSYKDGQLVTAGGRVLSVVGRGKTRKEALAAAYEAASSLYFEGMQWRSDIGATAEKVEAMVKRP